jgi:hypothetical protein
VAAHRLCSTPVHFDAEKGGLVCDFCGGGPIAATAVVRQFSVTAKLVSLVNADFSLRVAVRSDVAAALLASSASAFNVYIYICRLLVMCLQLVLTIAL